MFGAIGLVLLFCVAPPAGADIFKCSGRDGMPRYQNFPCELDSIGSAQPTVRAAAGPSSPQPASKPIRVAPTVNWTNATAPRVGMTPEEMKALWGDPMEILYEDTVAGRVEIWHYDDNSKVKFDSANRVAAVAR